jgi:hypothetical protein
LGNGELKTPLLNYSGHFTLSIATFLRLVRVCLTANRKTDATGLMRRFIRFAAVERAFQKRNVTGSFDQDN